MLNWPFTSNMVQPLSLRRDPFAWVESEIMNSMNPLMNVDLFGNTLGNMGLEVGTSRGQEVSNVTKVHYDSNGTPYKETLQTTTVNATDKGRKVVEKEKKYVNELLGEEKISQERLMGDKGHKIVRMKVKGKPEEVRNFFRGMTEDQLSSFNTDYEKVRQETRLPQVISSQNTTQSLESGRTGRNESELSRAFEANEGYSQGNLLK
jgi:hypothetical protein